MVNFLCMKVCYITLINPNHANGFRLFLQFRSNSHVAWFRRRRKYVRILIVCKIEKITSRINQLTRWAHLKLWNYTNTRSDNKWVETIENRKENDFTEKNLKSTHFFLVEGSIQLKPGLKIKMKDCKKHFKINVL